MNEEEKEAINYIKHFRDDDVYEGSVMAKNIDIIFAIIKKQQKEIETLKENHIFSDKAMLETLKECVSKRSIRKLIKEKAQTDTYNFKTIAVKDIEELLRG